MVTTGSAQPDIVLPGHAEVDTWVPDSGLPMTDLWLELHGDFRDIPMPPGPKGPDGAPGRPRATFVKMGAIANEAARPAVLGSGARGWWWHRIDTNGMDVWCGDHWQHSPNAVGAPGPIARPNTLTPLPVLRDERYTMAAARVRGRSPDNQTIEYTVPAGERGSRGPDGNVFGTTITDAPDYDDTYGPVNGSMFAYSRVTRRFRALSRPANGYGPYHFGATMFSGPSSMPTVDSFVFYRTSRVIATLDMPPMPFAWRPMVWSGVRTALLPGSVLWPKESVLRLTARLNQMDGQQIAQGTNALRMGKFDPSNDYPAVPVTAVPFFGDSQPVRIRDGGGGYGTVAAYEEASILICLEIQYDANNNAYVWDTSGAFADVWALPISANSGIAERKVDDVNTYPEQARY